MQSQQEVLELAQKNAKCRHEPKWRHIDERLKQEASGKAKKSYFFPIDAQSSYWGTFGRLAWKLVVINVMKKVYWYVFWTATMQALF